MDPFFVIPSGIPAAAEPRKFGNPYRGYRSATLPQRDNNGFVTRGIRTVAQVQTPRPDGIPESKCRYQMSDQLTLKGWFQSFFR